MKPKCRLKTFIALLFTITFAGCWNSALAESIKYAAVGYGSNLYYSDDQFTADSPPLYQCENPLLLTIYNWAPLTSTKTPFTDPALSLDGASCATSGGVWTITFTNTASGITTTLYTGCPSSYPISFNMVYNTNTYGAGTINVSYSGIGTLAFTPIPVTVMTGSPPVNYALSTCSTSICPIGTYCPCSNLCVYVFDVSGGTPFLVTDYGVLNSLIYDFDPGTGNSQPVCNYTGGPPLPCNTYCTPLNNIGPLAADWSSPGTHTITMDLPFGSCNITSSVTINVVNPAAFTYVSDCSGNVSFTSDPSSCLSGYSWAFNDGTGSTLQNPTHLFFPGTWTATLTGTDACGTTYTTSQTFTAGGAISGLTVPFRAPTCNGTADGSAVATIAGGPYIYVWSNGATTQSITGLSAGTYCVTVTNSSGCTAANCAIVTQPAAIVFSVSTTADGCDNGTASVTGITGGGGPYSYSWSNGATTQTITGQSGYIAGTPPGVTVTDANGCSASTTYIIGVGVGLFYHLVGDSTGCGVDTGTAMVVSDFISAPIASILWSTGSTTQSITGLSAGNYCVTVTSDVGCTVAECIIIGSLPYNATITATSTVLCPGQNTTLTASSSLPGATYSWGTYPPSGTLTGAVQTVTPTILPEVYWVSVTNGTSCSAYTDITVSESALCTICDDFRERCVFTLNKDTVCVGDSIFYDVSAGPQGAWERAIINGHLVHTSYSFVPPGGKIGGFPAPAAYIGANTVCLVIYQHNPDTFPATCTDTICHNLFIENCGCHVSPYVAISNTRTGGYPAAHPSDTLCVGDSVFVNLSGGTWGQFIVDDTSKGFIQLPAVIFGSVLVPGDVGEHHLCLVAYSSAISPDSLEAPYCNSFDDSLLTSGYATDNAFHLFGNTWLSPFQVTDGSPSIGNSGSGIAPYDGAQFAQLGVCPGGGCEGMELNYNFVAGQSYTVSLASCRGNYFQITANYYLLPTPLTHTYVVTGCTNDHCGTVPAGASLVYTNSPTSTTWGVQSFTFTPTSNYQSLWISVNSSATIGSDSAAVYCLDSFCVHPNVCSDTACINAWVINCGSCSAYDGQAVLQMTHLAGTTYQFKDNGTIEPNFVDWYVDGIKQGQTTGYGNFDYSFNVAGEHTICMNAAFVYTDSAGNNICCYQQACDSINVDSCDFWKATAQITYSLDVNNYHHVTFYYAGYTNNMTIVWNFGDGTSAVSSGEPVTHTYADSTWNVCAEVIWSLGDSAVMHVDSGGVCCCVDTICLNVNVTPCNAVELGLTFNTFYQITNVTPTGGALPAGGGIPVEPSLPAGLNFTSIIWKVNGTTEQTGGQAYGNSVPAGAILCAYVTYTISFDNGQTDTCSTIICDSVTGPVRRDYGLLRYFPNPTNDLLTVVIAASATDKTGEVELLDNLGRPVLAQQLLSIAAGTQQFYLDLSNVSPGLYMMKVTVGDKISTVKVVRD